MVRNSKGFVPFSTDEERLRPQVPPLSGSVSIRAPLTHEHEHDDYRYNSEFDVSTNATLSDNTASDSDASETDSVTARPLVADPESDYASEEELSAIHGATLRVMPFAHLSTYDDDDDDDDNGDEDEVEVEGDDELMNVARVPQEYSVVGAPRIKVLVDIEEQNAKTLVRLSSLPVSQSLLSDEFSFFNDDKSSNEAEDDTASVGIGLDDVLSDRVGYDECFMAADTDVMVQNSQDYLSNEKFEKVRVVLDELEKEELYGINRYEGIAVKMTENESIMKRKLEVDSGEAAHMISGISAMLGDTSLLKSVVEDYNTSSVHDLQPQDSQLHTDFRMTGEPASEAFAETVDYSTTQSSVADGSQGFAFDQESEREKLVTTTKSTINSEAELHNSSASFQSSDYDDCEGKQIESVESSECLDPRLLHETAYLENDLSEADLDFSQQGDLFCNYLTHEYVERDHNLGDKVTKEVTAAFNTVIQETKRNDSALDGDVEGLISASLGQFREQISALSILLGSKSSSKNCQQEQLVRSSEENMKLPRDDAKGQLINVSSCGELNGITATATSADESNDIFLKDPGSFSSLVHCKAQAGFGHNISEKEKGKIQRIQNISVKFLRLLLRVNLSLEDSFVSKVLCRLVADIGKRSEQELVIESAKVTAKKLEEDCKDDLDVSLNILVLGKSGVGKSATINSIFGDMKVMTNAFEPATTSVREVSGNIDGVKLRILDTPGLRSTMKEQAFNRNILSSVKRYMKKFPVDVILYVDRVDAQPRDLNDLLILRSITSSLSPSIWERAILTLTHAASTPLDGPSGSPLSYEVSVAQKSYLVQQSITQAVGDLCELSPTFMCPVSLVENHPSCREFVLLNGLRWRSQLLALCFSLKILSEVSSVPGPQTLFDHWKHFFFQNNSPPLSHIFSSLLQSHAHLKFKANWN